MSSHPPIQISCRLDPEDYRSFIMSQLYGEDYKKLAAKYQLNAIVRSVLLFPLYPFASVGLFYLADRYGILLLESWEFAFVLGCAMGVLQLVFNIDKTRFFKKQKMALSEYATEGSWPGFLGRFSVELGPEGIGYRCRGLCSNFQWDSVVSVERDSDWLLVSLSSGRAIMIKNDAIESDHSIEDVVRVIEQYWDARTSMSAIARGFLSEHALECAGCSYCLHGVDTDVCPECGREITMAELKTATTSR